MARRPAGSMKLAGLVLALLIAVSVVSALDSRESQREREERGERRELDSERIQGSESRDLDDRRRQGESERQGEGEREERERRREVDAADEGEREREREHRRRDLHSDEESRRERRQERRERRGDMDDSEGDRERLEREEREERERERRECRRRDLDLSQGERERREREEERERERQRRDLDDSEGERERREREEREEQRRERRQRDLDDSQGERERRERQERERERERRERRQDVDGSDGEQERREREERDRKRRERHRDLGESQAKRERRERQEREERERELRERRRDLDDSDGQRERREREEREERERERWEDSEGERERRQQEERERRERQRREGAAAEDNQHRSSDQHRSSERESEERERERRSRHRYSRRERSRRFRGERQLELSEPREELQFEGGEIRVWDRIRALEESNVYVQGAEIKLRQRGLVLPTYADSATIAYVQQGEGLVGLLSGYSLGETARRVRSGDVIAVPRGIAHWWYNSGNEDMRIITLADTSIGIERGDRDYTPFFLIGGRVQGQGGRREEEFQGILHGFRRELLAEAWDANESEVEELLNSQRNVGIIRVECDIDIERALINIIDDGDDNAQFGHQHGNTHYLSEFAYNVRHSTPDLRVEDAGHFTAVNRMKLPILNIVRLGLIHGHLERNAICAPHWSPNGHQIVHILRGSGWLEIVGPGGEQIVSREVSAGDVFAIPRFFASGTRAREDGLEWLSFFTTDMPYVEALAGKTSVYKNLPLQVAAAAFNVDEELERKFRNRRRSSALLLPPRDRSERQHAVE